MPRRREGEVSSVDVAALDPGRPRDALRDESTYVDFVSADRVRSGSPSFSTVLPEPGRRSCATSPSASSPICGAASIAGTMATTRYDFIIVGGGSAGSALANRLSADPATSVLVLEAGRSDWRIDPFIHMPAALTFPIGSRFYDWMYESEPEPFMDGRRIYHARGKVLGGSSSINGQIFQRGNPLDYERWAADPGMATWDYAHCLPYFKRMETCLAAAPDDPWRGHDGPLVLERGPGHEPAVHGLLRGLPARPATT